MCRDHHRDCRRLNCVEQYLAYLYPVAKVHREPRQPRSQLRCVPEKLEVVRVHTLRPGLQNWRLDDDPPERDDCTQLHVTLQHLAHVDDVLARRCVPDDEDVPVN